MRSSFLTCTLALTLSIAGCSNDTCEGGPAGADEVSGHALDRAQGGGALVTVSGRAAGSCEATAEERVRWLGGVIEIGPDPAVAPAGEPPERTGSGAAGSVYVYDELGLTVRVGWIAPGAQLRTTFSGPAETRDVDCTPEPGGSVACVLLPPSGM